MKKIDYFNGLNIEGNLVILHFNRFIILLGVLVLVSLPGYGSKDYFTETKIFRVLSSIDDAEENTSGIVNLTSSDLEFCTEKTEQTIGMRFANFDVDSGCIIQSAYLQFTTDEVSTGDCSINFWGELTTSSNSFVKENWNLSQRNKTSNKVNWQPEPWNQVGEAGVKQKSVELKSILQEVIGQTGWKRGGALTILAQGEGKRTAISFDKDPIQSPILVVELKIPVNREPIKDVFINEVMSKNNRIQDEYGNFDDWIELYNGAQTIVNLTGIYLSDSPRELTKWQLNIGKFLAPGECMLLWADDEPEQGAQHLNFKLSSKGETIYLSQLINGEVHLIDYLTFPEIPENSSYARVINGSANLITIGNPSPGASNDNSLRYLGKPSVVPESGFFTDSIAVDIDSSEDEVVFHCSFDGSMPTDKHPVFSKGMVIDSTLLFKVRAFKNGFAASDVVSRLFLFNDHNNLPVFNISMDPVHLWDDSIGIYTEGTNGTTLGNRPTVANYYQDWERPCVIEMIESDGTLAFQEPAAIEIGGNASQGQVQKTLNIHFRKSYGAQNIEYPIFKDLPVNEFGHLKLRNGGQDFRDMMVRDAINHMLLKEHTDVDVLSYRPAVVYLNGSYWGLYGLRESFNDDYLHEHFGYSKDSIDIVAGAGPWVRIEDGSDLDFEALYQYILNNDLSDEEVFTNVAEQIDIDEYIDYHIAQLYYSNSDWPANNVRIWRNNPGGKWRWHLFDTDASTNFSIWGKTYPAFNSLDFSTSATSTKWPNHQNATLFMRKLFANESFRYEFIQRACTYISLVFNPIRVAEVTDSIVSLIDGEISNHIDKWSSNYPFGDGITCGGSYEQWQSNISHYKNFFADRPGHFYQHMEDYFNLEKTFNLKIDWDTEGGTVVLNDNEVRIFQRFEANYFSHVPLKVKAIPASGYRFERWEETNQTSSELTLVTDQDCSLTPIFSPIGVGIETTDINDKIQIFPNPVKDDFLWLTTAQKADLEDVIISCFDLIGKCHFVVKRQSLNYDQSIKLNVANLSSGTYILKIVGENVNCNMKFIRLE